MPAQYIFSRYLDKISNSGVDVTWLFLYLSCAMLYSYKHVCVYIVKFNGHDVIMAQMRWFIAYTRPAMCIISQLTDRAVL